MANGFSVATVEGAPQSFREFVLSMTELVGMVREPDSTLLTTLTADTYKTYERSMIAAQERLAKLESMSTEDWKLRTQQEYDANERIRKAALTEQPARQANIQRRISQVEAWEPPSSEHEEFKRILLSQLNTCLKRDESISYKQPTKRISAAKNRKESIELARQNLKRCTENYEAILAATKWRKQWVEDLLASLPEDEIPAIQPENS